MSKILATDAALEALRASGIEVELVSQDAVNAVLGREGVSLMRTGGSKKKSAPETAELTSFDAAYTTVVSSADGAKVLNYLDNEIKKYENLSYVASNYGRDNIRVGKRRKKGASIFLLQIPDKYDNTLFVELSKDGSYWNVNRTGAFAKGYANKKETVAKTEPQQPNNAVSTGSSLSESNENGIVLSEPNGEPTVSSANKVRESSAKEQEKEQESWNES